MNIDVVICTYNSSKTIKKCIEGVKSYIAVSNIIVVDGDSDDGTLEILATFSDVEVFVEPSLSLSQAREFAFSKVKTEWFLQLDSDVVLTRDPVELAKTKLSSADAVEFGVDNIIVEPLPEDASSFSYQRRAFFFATLLRTSSIPELGISVRHMEEELMRRRIEDVGGKWLKDGAIVGEHFSEPMRYEGRNIVSVVRCKPLPKWVYYDMGRIDRATNASPKSVIVSLATVCSNSLNYGVLRAMWDSSRIPVTAVFYYLKGYFRK